jgi:hypothetical protein
MNRWQILLAVLLFATASLSALAQNPATTNDATGLPAAASPPSNPAEKSAEKQSGLSKEEAQSLLLQNGFTWLSDLHPEPGSIWVWQADAMENGRRVRVGIDYRGRVLVISGSANPSCRAPGVNLGVSGLGVGARLSEGTSCARR